MGIVCAAIFWIGPFFLLFIRMKEGIWKDLEETDVEDDICIKCWHDMIWIPRRYVVGLASFTFFLLVGIPIAYLCAGVFLFALTMLALSLVFSSIGIVMFSVYGGGNGQLFLMENCVRYMFSCIAGYLGGTLAADDIRSPAKMQLFIVSALIDLPCIYYRYAQMCDFESLRDES